MKNELNYSKIKFDNRLDAQAKLDSLKHIAEMYGCVYVTDFYDVCGYEINYDEQNDGWTIDMLEKTKVVYANKGEYYIDLPKALPLKFTNDKTTSEQKAKVTYRDYYSEKPRDAKPIQPEPITITIHTNEIDVYDPDEIISSVLKQISQIKDRTVNLTIM